MIEAVHVFTVVLISVFFIASTMTLYGAYRLKESDPTILQDNWITLVVTALASLMSLYILWSYV